MRTQTEEKRRAILYATLEEFEARGFAAARIEDIAKKAGVAKGTVYNYFESKEALLMGLAEDLGNLIHENLGRAMKDSAPMSTRQRIEEVFEPIIRENGRGRMSRILRVIWSEGLHRPQLTRPFFEKFLLPAFGEEGFFTRMTEKKDFPVIIREYPFLIAAPLIQGVLWQTLLGDSKPLEFRRVFKAYLDLIFGEEDSQSERKEQESNIRRQKDKSSLS